MTDSTNSSLQAARCLHCHDVVVGSGLYCCHACEILFQMSEVNGFKLPHSEENKFSKYLFLDQANFDLLYRSDKNTKDYQVFIGGLECSSCVHLLERLPEFYNAILETRVNFSNSNMQIKLGPTGKLSKVLDLIESFGYKPKIMKPGQSLKDNHKIENRKMLMRIGVAGAAAGNMMLYVVPIYSGLKGDLAQTFNWICFFLFLPILFYSAVPFYRGAWNSLKHKVVSVDLPITVALWLGFIVSTFNLVLQQSQVYFDSTASFIFFILVARYLLKKVQQFYLFTPEFDDLIATEKIQRRTESGLETIPLNQIKIGDELVIYNQQFVPADGVLISDTCHLDLSLLTGESLPQRNFKNMQVFAGSKVFSESMIMKVQAVSGETRLGQLLYNLNLGSKAKTDFSLITDKLAQYLIVIVLLTATIFFAFYMNVSVQQAINRCLALIVLACPCALAFGTPLAQGLAIRKAKKIGILIKNPAVLEKILIIKNLFLDKTGTLTRGQLIFYQSFPAPLSKRDKEIILGLETISFHPVAQSLRQQWSDISPVTIIKPIEIVSEGVEGYYDGDFYQLKASAVNDDRGLLQIEFIKNGSRVAYLYFSDQLRDDTLDSVHQLRSHFNNISILSGDRSSEVLKIAQSVQIAKRNTHIGFSAEEKADLIRQTPGCCMVGDGSNDSLALQAADVGIAVAGSADLSLTYADVYLTESGLKPILKLIQLSKRAQRTVKVNIGISLTYNLVGAVLALTGFISPMVAAILMPISSLILILSTLWGLR